MFRMWCKIFNDNHMVRDITIEDGDYEKSRTKKVFDALEQCCREFDLAAPIWLDSTIQDFKRHDKTRFTKDNFLEAVEFDYLEIHVIEEDDFY